MLLRLLITNLALRSLMRACSIGKKPFSKRPHSRVQDTFCSALPGVAGNCALCSTAAIE
jgi:hypothetical protein